MGTLTLMSSIIILRAYPLYSTILYVKVQVGDVGRTFLCAHECMLSCWLLPSNQSFYRQITGDMMDVNGHRVD